ncbi:MAG: peptide/nickel transport system substrate-binding protein [Frankiaceae bacterium]|nr:peptide/nickel transport system substrate-binding protein [Frankiaceae bacterium]
MRRIKRAAVAGVAAVLAAACSSNGNHTVAKSATPTPPSSSTASNTTAPSATAASSTSSASAAQSSATAVAPAVPHKPGGSVTISNASGASWTCQFNPFNPAVSGQAIGFVYETLVYVNSLKAGAETPMLASSYKWSDDKKSIVFTVRDGAKWNDGEAFTADDVAFTFNMLKKTPAMDLYSLWTGAGLQSATASGTDVTLTFDKPAQVYFYLFAGSVAIVPKHIWSTGDAAAKLETWADPKPVGTGPFTVDPCGPNNITYQANKNYWQPGKPAIQTVQYPAYLDNNPANLDLANGKAQWGGQFIPNIDTFFSKKSKDNNYWFPPMTNVALLPNLDPSHKATSTLAVRQAIAAGLDREQVSKIGESGYQPAANQSGIALPTFEKYFDAAALAASGYDKPNVDKAKQLLAGAGYTPDKPLKLDVITVSGYTDWDASLAVIKQQLKPLGIDLTIQDLEGQTYNDRLYKGNFDLAYGPQLSGGPTPYYELRQLLHSKNSAPIGTAAPSNYMRYNNPEVDALFDKYPTVDEAGQVDIIKAISARMIADVPFIPTTESVDWYQYNTSDLDGWPTKENAYAQPAPWNVPDNEQVLLNLFSKSAQS